CVPESRRVLRQALSGLGRRRRGRAGLARARREDGRPRPRGLAHGIRGARRARGGERRVPRRPRRGAARARAGGDRARGGRRAAALGWLALGQVLLVVTAALVLRRRAAEPARLVAVLAVAALSQPLVETLRLGQANVVVLALLALGWWGARQGRPWGAALALGLAVHVKPQFGLPIAALWWIGQRAVAYRAAAVAAAGLAAGVAAVGPGAHVDWVR